MASEKAGGTQGAMSPSTLSLPAWFDAHAHVTEDALSHHDLPAYGIRVLNAVQPAEASALLDLHAQNPRLLPCVGVHPWRAGEVDLASASEIGALLEAHPQLHVGETGLDSGCRGAPWEDQISWLDTLLSFASTYQRVVSLHLVKAAAALEAAVNRLPQPPPGLLLHAWSGPPDRVDWWIERGAYFSWNPRHSDTRRGRAGFAHVPAERLLVETDNAPAASLADALTSLAALRGMDVAELAEQTAENGLRLFRQE